jgi:uncharacterized protein (TIGR00288 family)
MHPRSASPAAARASRSPVAPLHRGPQASALGGTSAHAPNAALLIDFDNVTMGIRSDLQTELRNLLSSAIISGKVAVQRAYADWRRYPQYIVPLSESSIDLIFAPAYGSSKKNATDIRLAVDAIELVFTRPEIGTYILLSGDSDFSSLVLKLKEYGKYVIGVGIRESSSDLLVQNCDEYYSYNALAGLVKTGEENGAAKKWDPWELVTEAIGRMQKNGDVMRADRLKQVMQEIDATFDEKDLGMSKFSRFCMEAAQKGLLHVAKLENGQLEVGLPKGGAAPVAPAAAPAPSAAPSAASAPRADGEREEREGRSRRGRRGRGGRGRERDERPATPAQGELAVSEASAGTPVTAPSPKQDDTIGVAGIRLTRDEAFGLIRDAVNAVTAGDNPVPSETVRAKAFALLGRDSESLSAKNFARILKDAHDAGILDLRKRGQFFEVTAVADAPSIADQLNAAEAAHTPAPVAAAPAPRGMGARGIPSKGGARGAKPVPPSLLLLGVVEHDEPVAKAEAPQANAKADEAKGAKKKAVPAKKKLAKAEGAAPKAKKPAAKKKAPKA